MFTAVAVLIGLVIGLVSGGSLWHLAERSFRSVWLLVVGVVLQVLTEVVHLPKPTAYVAVLASYLLLAVFAVRNLRLAGMGVVAIGLALNIVPIAVNQGMPVRPSAIVQAGIASADKVATLGFGGKRHLQGPGDHLTVLGDVLPDWIFHEVLSFGDLVMAMGIAAVFVNLTRPARRRSSGKGAGRKGKAPADEEADGNCLAFLLSAQ